MDKKEVPIPKNTHPLTKEELRREIQSRVSSIDKEFAAAFEFLAKFPRSVSFFGSTRVQSENEHYRKAERLAGRIARELGYTVLTGGSAGIMEAANKGAREAGGQSVGLNIKLPRVQHPNPYTTDTAEFSYFFVRKVALSFAAESYIFFPGGFGTLDEFFEIVTLVQTHKIRRVPIFLVGKDYWEPLHAFIRENLYEVHRAIAESDMTLYTITDDEEKIVQAIRTVPVYDGHLHSAPRK